jgi:serine/threonine-protein kinase RsbW
VPDESPPFQISLSLILPRDERTLPVVRHLVVTALAELGATEDARDDVALALTEACTNVLRHTREGDAYDVEVRIVGARCEIRVKDRGSGFDPDAIPAARPGDETGRGVALMRAVVDRVDFIVEPEEGTLVLMSKVLDFPPGAVASELIDQDPGRVSPLSDVRD